MCEGDSNGRRSWPVPYRPIMRTPSHRRFGLAAAALALALPAGCLPQRVVIDLKAGGAELKESTIIVDEGAAAAPKVALIEVSGLIAGVSVPGLFQPGPNPVDELVARLDMAARDRAVRAVVLRINSTGGTVTGSETMAREVRRFAESTGKPVVSSMGEVAASGGFFVAVAADRVVAEPTTVTGSIGVIMQTFNIEGTLKMIGASARAVTSGPNKDLASPFAPEREEQYAILQGMVDEFYGRFRAHVIRRRPSFDAAANDWALDGRVITGAEAERIHLVDETGGVREAFAAAKRLTDLPAARLVTYHADTRSPRTPYSPTASAGARGEAGPGGTAGAGGEREINLLQINASAMWGGLPAAPGFYFLWVP